MRAVLWERLDEPGWESICLAKHATGYVVEGRYLGRQAGLAVAADYRILLDPDWATRRLDAAWGLGPGRQEISLERLGARWHLDGNLRQDLDGCIDIDIRWTPLTNALPIRRLALPEGSSREIGVAWLGERDLEVHRATQRYTCTGRNAYRFDALDSGFMAELQVDDDGLVVDYPGLFRRLA